MSEKLMELNLSQIEENPSALRPAATDSLEFKELVQSIAKQGVLQSVLVRPILNEAGEQKTNDAGEPCYYLVDGLQRFTASREAGRTTIPCAVRSMTDEEALKIQIVANVQRVETTPVQYSAQLNRLLAINPSLTQAELAADLGKTPSWLGDLLGLVKLTDEAQKLVDEGHIKLTAAYALAKLPEDKQGDFIERAQTMQPEEFLQTCNNYRKELKKAQRAGKAAGGEEFSPTPHMQKMADIRVEQETPNVGSTLISQIPGIEDMLGSEAALAGYRMGLQWVLHLDPSSVAEQRRKFDEAQRKIAERRKGAAEERGKNRLKELELKAERLALETELIRKGEDPKAGLEAWDKANHFVKGRYCPPEPKADAAPAAVAG